MTEKKKEEIRIDDKRHFDKEGNPVQSEGRKEEKEKVRGAASNTEPREKTEPEKVEFIAILFSYIHTALIYLGEMKDPAGQTTENLEGARQMIEILELMQEKTKGNLTGQEEQYLQSALYDLRMRYMKKSNLIK
jgi:hypothetical protein